MALTLKCPGCGVGAPVPGSAEAARWLIGRKGGTDHVIVLCPDCGGNAAITRRVEDDARRQAAIDAAATAPIDFDRIVTVRGIDKAFGECTGDDLEWLAEDVLARSEQARAWVWFKASSILKREKD